MLINTHMIIASNLLNYANSKKVYLINKKRFIWGNIKPDCTPKYKLVKHYYDESYDMIIDKIKELGSLSISDILFDYGKSKFSEELGVICHFLCDFFCLPHYGRWEFKKSMKKHVVYENNLSKIAKVYKPAYYIDGDINLSDIGNFINRNLEIYKKNQGYKNDLEYSYFICNSVINVILNKVMKNEYLKERKVG